MLLGHKRSALPPWSRDELILALDLYLRERRILDKKNEQIIELSNLLNRLPIHSARPEDDKFRNPNGVNMKLANFAAIDPSYNGKGLTSYSMLDKEVWECFHDKPEELHRLAENIRNFGPSATFSPEEGEDEIEEGKLLFRQHRKIEKAPALLRKKKAEVLRTEGHLMCEACRFDFEKVYGILGNEIAECHSLLDLRETGHVQTRTMDLAIVCPNCHRMLHRSKPRMTIKELQKMIGVSV